MASVNIVEDCENLEVRIGLDEGSNGGVEPVQRTNQHRQKIIPAILSICVVIVVVSITVAVLLRKTDSPGQSSSNALIVTTTYGPVEGFYLLYNNSISSTTSVIQVKAWRGIPYAAPPIGALRWQPPGNPSPWATPLPCKEFQSQCVQPVGDPMQTGGNGTESCLFLNVYYYSTNSGATSLPVLFYMHGGGLMAGAGTDDMTPFLVHGGNGTGMVIVQINYRLNLFGFYASKSLSKASSAGVSGNYGIQDQLLALQWVRANIANFGGDPNRVTISGQSSGGTSVFALMSSPKSKGLYTAGISLSGSPNISTSLLKAELENGYIFNTTNCTQSQNTYTEINACLRALNATEVQQNIPPAWNTPGLWGMPIKSIYGQHYDSVVIVDGVTVVASFENALSEGLIDVPLLFGNMAYEPDEGPDVDVSGYSAGQWLQFLNQSFAPWGPTVGSKMYELYINNSLVNPQMAYDAIVSDYGLSCASVDLGRAALPPTGSRKSPLYAYYNEWGLSKAYEVPGEDGYISRFAHHDEDYWMLTESWSSIGNGTYTPTPTDLQGTTFQQNLWYEFMSNRGVLGPSWATINSAPSWPSNYIINLIQSKSPSAPVPSTNFKSNVCSYFNTLQINNPSYWWCN